MGGGAWGIWGLKKQKPWRLLLGVRVREAGRKKEDDKRDFTGGEGRPRLVGTTTIEINQVPLTHFFSTIIASTVITQTGHQVHFYSFLTKKGKKLISNYLYFNYIYFKI